MTAGLEEKKENILAARFGGLGDLLITLPSIQLIKKKRPQTQITLVARQSYGLFLKEAEVIETLLPLEAHEASLLFQAGEEIPGLKLLHYDLVLIWLNKEPAGMEAFWRRRFGEKLRLIVWPGEADRPLARYFLLKTAEIFNIHINRSSEEKEYALLTVKEKWLEKAQSHFPWLKDIPYVVLHPGSGRLIKRWKLENFLSLIDFFVEKRIGGIVITGPAEESYLTLLSACRWPDRWGWAHEPDLRIVCGLLSGALLYIGNDSGITHLAASCGCSGLAFFRQENFPAWSPWSDRIKIIVASELESIEIESAVEKIQELVASKKDGFPKNNG